MVQHDSLQHLGTRARTAFSLLDRHLLHLAPPIPIPPPYLLPVRVLRSSLILGSSLLESQITNRNSVIVCHEVDDLDS